MNNPAQFLADNGTIQEAKNFLRQNFEEGATCPCCQKLVKLWRYSIHATMARLLIELYLCNLKKANYYYIGDLWDKVGISSRGGDFSKLMYWGLIEQMPKQETEKQRSTGYWKITRAGIAFVRGNRIVKNIYTFNKKVERYGHQTTNITEALNKKFDYNKLMGIQNPQATATKINRNINHLRDINNNQGNLFMQA